MKKIQLAALLSIGIITLSCNSNSSHPGQNTTDAGTQQSSKTNSEMEGMRTASDVDTVTSPGSNSEQLKAQESKIEVEKQK